MIKESTDFVRCENGDDPLLLEIKELKQGFGRVVMIELDEMDSRQYVEFIWLFRSLYFNGEMMDQVKWMMKQGREE